MMINEPDPGTPAERPSDDRIVEKAFRIHDPRVPDAPVAADRPEPPPPPPDPADS